MADAAARFDRLYADDPDPWGFETSPYEAQKYRATLDALPRRRYRLGVEAGCSIGVLTRMLSFRCDRLIGVDVSEVALKRARERCADRPHVGFLRAELPLGWPEAQADLVVLSEVLYFLDEAGIDTLAGSIAAALAPDGDCVLVNYLRPTGERLQGAEAGDLFAAALARRVPVSLFAGYAAESYRIELLRREADAPLRPADPTAS